MASPPAHGAKRGGSLKENNNVVLLGVLIVKIKRGFSLAVRDITDSDPYVVIKIGDQKQKTRIVNKDINPVWDEELTLSVQDSNLPIKLISAPYLLLLRKDKRITVYDHDMLSKDDLMGDAEFDIKSFIEALNMPRLERHPNGTVLKRIPPSTTNYLAKESNVIWKDKEVVQQLSLRLRNVETGEVEIELRWAHESSTTL